MRQPAKKRTPSPAMVVAMVALFAALSGTAIALPGKNKVNSADIKKGSVKSSDLKDGAVKSKDIGDGQVSPLDLAPQSRIWANVNSQGNLVSASTPGATVGRVGNPGKYFVDFNLGDISACAAVAQIRAYTPEDNAVPGGSAATETLPGANDAYRVDTTNPNGAQADRGFSLIVVC